MVPGAGRPKTDVVVEVFGIPEVGVGIDNAIVVGHGVKRIVLGAVGLAY